MLRQPAILIAIAFENKKAMTTQTSHEYRMSGIRDMAEIHLSSQSLRHLQATSLDNESESVTIALLSLSMVM
jgi:hypothetical protein